MTEEKSVVRAAALARRRGLTDEDRDAADRTLATTAADLVRGRGLVAAYAPLPGEPGGDYLLAALTAVVGTLLLPVVRPDRDLDWAPFGRLVPGGLGVREPAGPRLGPDAIAEVEIALVPAVAVDRSGVRLGRGGGSFDRALARVPSTTPVLAILYDGEVVERLPSALHDRPVTGVVTPGAVLDVG